MRRDSASQPKGPGTAAVPPLVFLNAQKPGLIKDPYIYKPDSIMLDLKMQLSRTRKMQQDFPCFMY